MLVRICETWGESARVNRWCAIRDLYGRLRLAVKLQDGASPDLDTLEMQLTRELGAWFVPKIVATTSRNESGRLAAKAFESSQEWLPSYEDLTHGGQTRAAGNWRKLERRLSKQDWLDSPSVGPPWQLGEGPSIITYYSFKGGVGRTTALVSCAWQLSAAGKKVALIDLDLEAPGLGALLEVETDRGIVDFVVDYVATESRDLWGMHGPAMAFGPEYATNVEVFPCGNLEQAYLEKLARLDFVGDIAFGSKESPAAKALRALLQAVRQHVRPDYILIDSRAGLHDIAGLSLHGLAHVDVLVGRASEQAFRGFELTLSALTQRRSPDDFLCVVVHTMAPTDSGSTAAIEEEQTFMDRTYAAFCEFVYEDDAPQKEATDQAHWPWVIRYDSALERFTSVSGIRSALFNDNYKALLTRVVELCQEEEEDES